MHVRCGPDPDPAHASMLAHDDLTFPFFLSFGRCVRHQTIARAPARQPPAPNVPNVRFGRDCPNCPSLLAKIPFTNEPLKVRGNLYEWASKSSGLFLPLRRKLSKFMKNRKIVQNVHILASNAANCAVFGLIYEKNRVNPTHKNHSQHSILILEHDL
jgi:hypothetical protein